MEGLPGQDGFASPDMVRARVLKDAQQSHVGVDSAEIEQCVQTALGSLWTEQTRVTTFIPVLALREVREMLERRAGAASG